MNWPVFIGILGIAGTLIGGIYWVEDIHHKRKTVALGGGILLLAIAGGLS